LCCAACEEHDLGNSQRDDREDEGEQDSGHEQPLAAGFESPLGRTLGDDSGTRRRLEMPRPTRIVIEWLRGDHHRLAVICAIKSSSDLGRRGALSFATVLAGTGFADCGAARDASDSSGSADGAL
jgi:hypothetical protein